jgi:hypothetical protein
MTDTTPAWTHHILANIPADDAAFARVLAAMPFNSYRARTTWDVAGLIWGWAPPYRRARRHDDTARWFPQRHADHRHACIAEFLARDRDGAAADNRRMASMPVHVLTRDAVVVLVLQRDGEWRTADRVNQGPDLISLGQWMWGCRYGQACARIASAAGLSLPTAARNAA